MTLFVDQIFGKIEFDQVCGSGLRGEVGRAPKGGDTPGNLGTKPCLGVSCPWNGIGRDQH